MMQKGSNTLLLVSNQCAEKGSKPKGSGATTETLAEIAQFQQSG